MWNNPVAVVDDNAVAMKCAVISPCNIQLLLELQVGINDILFYVFIYHFINYLFTDMQPTPSVATNGHTSDERIDQLLLTMI